MSDTKPNDQVIKTGARLGVSDPRGEFIDYLIAKRRWADAEEEHRIWRRELEATPEFKLLAVFERFGAEWENADDHEKLRLLQEWRWPSANTRRALTASSRITHSWRSFCAPSCRRSQTASEPFWANYPP
jgi:hypothetical protein